MPKRQPQCLIQKARDLRIDGASYNVISNKLGVSKSTLHYWFKYLPLSPFQRDPKVRNAHLFRIRKLAIAAIHAKKERSLSNIRDKVRDEMPKFPFNDIYVQKAILSFLYWAEGSKTTAAFKFTNTDPALCLFFVTLMRNSLAIDEKNIRICLHLHWYHNVKRTINFWSKLLIVPRTQFENIYIKSRKKTKRKRKNFAGICFIKYGKGGENLKQEVLYFAKAIQEKLSPMRP